MMIWDTSSARTFAARMRESLSRHDPGFRSLRFAKHKTIFVCGDAAESVYFIESGHVKLLMLSPEGKECLLAIHIGGDTFGELCLAGAGRREETAVAMEDTVVKELPCEIF